MAESQKSKEELEKEKLVLEMKYMKRNSFIQMTNSGGILILGFSVLLIFQVPQINLMSEQKDTDRRIEIARLIIDVQKIEDKNVQSNILAGMSDLFPKQDFLSVITRTQKAESESREYDKTCKSLVHYEAQREQDLEDIKKRLDIEISGAKGPDATGLSGHGPVAQALEVQMYRIQDDLVQTRRRLLDEKCG
jgi:hypothetical protein